MYLTTKDSVRLFYHDWGRGEPIILIHGWPLNADMWEYQARRLVHDGYRVISYDRRGFGRSSQPFEGYNYDVMAEDLAELINQLDLESVTLVGFSMGGGEVARYFSHRTDGRIAKAVLISSVVPFMLKTKDNPEGVDESVFEDMINELEGDRPHFLAQFANKFYGVGALASPVSNEILQWTFNMAIQASPEATIECVKAFSRTDFRQDMKNIVVPTLVIHGKEDQIVPINTSGRIAAEGIPNAVAKFYDGAPHALFATHKDLLYQDLKEFIAGTSINVSPQKEVAPHPTPLH